MFVYFVVVRVLGIGSDWFVVLGAVVGGVVVKAHVVAGVGAYSGFRSISLFSVKL